MVVDDVRCYADGGKNCNYFTAKVHCKNSLCTVFEFIVKTPITVPYVSTFATVFRCIVRYAMLLMRIIEDLLKEISAKKLERK